MNEIQYLNEHIMPGIVGKFLIVLSFISAFYTAVSYYFASKYDVNNNPWLKKARIGFFIHGAAVFGIIGTLLYILFNHLYEYKYAWDHLNSAMPMKYVFSCMWEGQEGSFLLWTFWHVVLGFVLIRFAKNWEPTVMAVIAMVQFFLASMLMGVYFGDFQFGSNPFLLLREHASNIGLPWTMRPDYLSLKPFQDGKGLNPLLQNYWMTIHPPTLFLGFASTIVPFAYAIAGLWKKDFTGWMKPAIPWAFFGVMILGTGILMGGAWAYEALGFGGFWAWDPVENASLVPWLILVAAAHLLVINQKKGTSVYAALLLSISSFILVLYSTFLTRSGVLGDSSVHSFVDSGILAQLLVYLLFFTALSTYLMVPDKKWQTGYLGLCAVLLLIGLGDIITYKTDLSPEELEKLLPGEDTLIPTLTLIFLLASLVMLLVGYRKKFRKPASEEEALWSREFWMFIGALVLIISALHITVVTSVNVGNIFLTPFEGLFASLHETTGWNVFKRLSDHNFSAPGDKERFEVYHRIQVPLAFLLFLIVSFGQFLKYKNTEFKSFIKKISLSLIASLAVVILLALIYKDDVDNLSLLLLVWACLFAMFANIDYAFRVLRGKFDIMGASVAHLGFAMLILGAVFSTWQSYFISRNVRGNISDFSQDFKNSEDLMIFMGDTLPMGDYFIHYKEKSKRGERVFCTVEYFDKKPKVYSEGDYVQVFGQPFRAVVKHEASESFLKDATEDSLWTQVTPAEVDAHDTEHLDEWIPGLPGDRLFVLEPSVLMSPKGNSREPSIAHFLNKDIYTFIKHTEVDEKKTDEEGYLEPKSAFVGLGTEIRLTEIISMRLDSIVPIDSIPENLPEGIQGKRVFGAITDGHDTENIVLPVIWLKDSVPFTYPVESQTFRMLFALSEKPEGLELTVQKHKSSERDLLIMTAEVFPQINVLWIGCLVMVIGTVMAIRHRYKLSKIIDRK
jgi:cytochrome c-type biogenesis protein CcmF